jgi:phage-related protein
MLSWKFTYNGFTLNDSSEFESDAYTSLQNVGGLSSPEVLHTQDELVGQHGIVDYYSFITNRIITLEGGVVGTNEDNMLVKLKELTDAFTLPAVPTENNTGYSYLTMEKAGEDSKRILAKVHSLPRIEKTMHINRMRRFFLSLRCENPRIESTTLKTQTINKAYKEGTLPMILPARLGVEGSWENEVTILNDGNFGALPTIVINGPCVNPILTNVSYPSIFQQFILTLLAGESITIDSLNGTATKNDGTDVLPLETDDSNWHTVFPGNNIFRFGSVDVDFLNGDCEIQWRDTFLSVPR